MTESFEKYSDYTVSQFVLEDDFIDWVKQPTNELDLFWNSFLTKSPHQSDNVRRAKMLVSGLKVETETADEQTKDRIWNAIKNQSVQQAPVVQMKSRKWLIAAAAAILIIAASVAFFQMMGGGDGGRQIIQTAYGEKKTIILPDNSTVVLNAASKIDYKKKWDNNTPREVWIDGEAFFDVVHKNKAGTEVRPSERFIVHLKNMDVEVLGTTFTVNTRRSEEQVVLQTGSVKVALKNKTKEVYLKPGEMLRYSKAIDSIKKEETKPEVHSSWKNNLLTFNQTSLKEIATLIEDNYGYKVKITDTSLLSKNISGTLSSENEDILFKALETMLDVKIVMANNTITISRK